MSTTTSFPELFLRVGRHGPESRVLPYPLDPLATLSESKYLLADSGGVPAYKSSRLSFPANSCATTLYHTLSPFLTNTHRVPTIFPSGSLFAYSRVTLSHTPIWDINPIFLGTLHRLSLRREVLHSCCREFLLLARWTLPTVGWPVLAM